MSRPCNVRGSIWAVPCRLCRSAPFYYVDLVQINIGNKLVQGSQGLKADSQGDGGVILDTGSTVASMPPALFEALLADVRLLSTLCHVPCCSDLVASMAPALFEGLVADVMLPVQPCGCATSLTTLIEYSSKP